MHGEIHDIYIGTFSLPTWLVVAVPAGVAVLGVVVFQWRRRA